MARHGGALTAGLSLAVALAAAAGAPGLAQAAQNPIRAVPPIYPPVVAQALGAITGRVGGLPLGAPTTLPPEPPSHTYLTARTAVSGRGWRVQVLKADQAYAVNNPAILTASAHAKPVVAFGIERLAAPLSALGSAARAIALWRAGLRARGLASRRAQPPLPSGGALARVALGSGIVGSLYAAGGGTDTLVWHEGDWTLAVVDTTSATAQALARPIVAYLHRAFLPPDPGLIVVAIGVHGVYTRIDWRVGPLLYYVDNDLRAGDNPVSACAMAVTWQTA